jgi:hypothetical protein
LVGGAALLGWVAGEMAIGDPAISGWIEHHAYLHTMAPIAGALFVVGVGKWLEGRARTQAAILGAATQTAD